MSAARVPTSRMPCCCCYARIAHRLLGVDDRIVGGAIAHAAAERGFSVSHQTVEIEGICRDCAGLDS